MIYLKESRRQLVPALSEDDIRIAMSRPMVPVALLYESRNIVLIYAGEWRPTRYYGYRSDKMVVKFGAARRLLMENKWAIEE